MRRSVKQTARDVVRITMHVCRVLRLTCLFFFSVVLTENWKKINNDPVCFGAKEDKYGAFNITEAGEIYTFKLVYRNGYLRCNPRHPASHWGCTNSGAVAQEKALLTVITYNNRTALPIAEYARFNGSGGQKCPYYSYSIDGIDVNSTELVFNRLTSPVLARTGQEFQIWYGHDLVNCSEKNNSGQTCVDVYGWYN